MPERSVVRPEYDDVYEDANWWSSGDDSGANTFLTMPYFPFLSSCAGYGHHMSFAKLVESHPDCTLVSAAHLFLYQWSVPTTYQFLVAVSCVERHPADSENLYVNGSVR